MHHLSTSTYIPNFIEIEESFFGRTYGRVYGHLRPTLLGRLGGVDLIIPMHMMNRELIRIPAKNKQMNRTHKAFIYVYALK